MATNYTTPTKWKCSVLALHLTFSKWNLICKIKVLVTVRNQYLNILRYLRVKRTFLSKYVQIWGVSRMYYHQNYRRADFDPTLVYACGMYEIGAYTNGCIALEVACNKRSTTQRAVTDHLKNIPRCSWVITIVLWEQTVTVLWEQNVTVLSEQSDSRV